VSAFGIVGAGAGAGVLLGLLFVAIAKGVTICGGCPPEQQKKQERISE